MRQSALLIVDEERKWKTVSEKRGRRQLVGVGISPGFAAGYAYIYEDILKGYDIGTNCAPWRTASFETGQMTSVTFAGECCAH